MRLLRHAPRRTRRPQQGVALLLTLFIVLIVAVVVVQLAVTTTAEYAISNNVATVARLDAAIDSALVDARKALLDDAQSSGSGGAGGAGGGLPGMSGGGMPMGGAGGGGGMPGAGGEGEQADADCLNDPWANDQETSIGEATVKVHIEDENRKFNLLSIVSKDQDYARQSFERLVRLLDMLREVDFGEPSYDLETAVAEQIATNIRQWLDGSGRKDFQRPNLLSNLADSPVTLPLSLDELIFVEGVDENLLYDMKVGDIIYPGLTSVLTVWTAIQAGPVKSEETSSSGAPGSSTGGTSGAGGTSGSGNSNPSDPNSQGQSSGDSPQTPGKPKDPAIAAGKSQGVKININTAPPCLLRALMPTFEIPTDVIEAVIRYRNSLDEEKLNSQRESGEYSGGDVPAGVDPGTKLIDRTSLPIGEIAPPAKFFATPDDLNKVDEWKNYTNETAKKEFAKLVTCTSDVFSIYITARPTSGFGSNEGQKFDAFEVKTRPDGTIDPEDAPGGVVKRIRQVVWRRTGNNEPTLLPVVVREERYDRKFSIPDYPLDPSTGKPNFR